MTRLKRRHLGFTLIELLVVISIIALLVGILLPALGAARKAAQDSACKSNMRQLGQAFHMYVTDDAGGYLPSGWTFGFTANTGGDELGERKWNGWYVGRYFGYSVPDPAHSTRFTGFGASYLRCPGQEADAWRTYGINYNGVWGWTAAPNGENGQAGSYGPRLEEVWNGAFLAADHHGRLWHNGSEGNRSPVVYSPHPTKGWGLNTDWDGDGMLDSFGHAAWIPPNGGTIGPYNGVGFLAHNRTANFLFKDGHAESLNIQEWATNRGGAGLWGH